MTAGPAVLPDGGPRFVSVGGSAAQCLRRLDAAGTPGRVETGEHTGGQTDQGALTTVAGWMTGVHSRCTAMTTTVTVPRLVPTRPPSAPSAPDSARNWTVMCRPRAPSARRRPISPVRSSTATSVVLAMPTAPMTRQIPASSMKSWFRSDVTLPRRVFGSGGGTTLKWSGWAGSRASAASEAICRAAPRSVEMSILARSPLWGPPQISSAVVRGTTTDSSRSALRRTSSTMPMTVKARSPTKTAGAVSRVEMPSRDASPEPITATFSPCRSW